eukprot:TRINITY_DN1315_c0_g3_i5.p1 TRINITY_DN1315_c0_g3~~TRINITY_DN1315_c0_g3_i5.p1  ORF type:complete len:216 (-),score=40.99 TRINITY_DN1315_c0_g3_i5:896-1543(-)
MWLPYCPTPPAPLPFPLLLAISLRCQRCYLASHPLRRSPRCENSASCQHQVDVTGYVSSVFYSLPLEPEIPAPPLFLKSSANASAATGHHPPATTLPSADEAASAKMALVAFPLSLHKKREAGLNICLQTSPIQLLISKSFVFFAQHLAECMEPVINNPLAPPTLHFDPSQFEDLTSKEWLAPGFSLAPHAAPDTSFEMRAALIWNMVKSALNSV